MQFIIDESAGSAVVEYLRQTGHDVIAVHEKIPQATDGDVLALASAENRILVTNDKDFGDLVFRSGKPHHGILLLRLRDESAKNRVRVMRGVMDNYADRLEGNYVVATERGVRIRTVR